MDNDERNAQPSEAWYVLVDDAGRVEQRTGRRGRLESQEEIVDPWSYAAKRGRGTIRLSLVEYRILRFLSARPNRAFSYHRIAEAISTPRHRVTIESLSRYIH